VGLGLDGVVVLVRALANRDVFRQPPGDDALAILRRRYAAGEITREQFEERR
jgi:uncharacterized membrane protein